MTNKKIIILIGAPGSGKGTQANLLAQKLDLYHLETSKLLENTFKNKQEKEFVEINKEKYYFEKEKDLWETGELCSTPFTLFLIQEKIKKISEQDMGIIFTGSPRKLQEAKILMPFLEKLFNKENIKTILLELDVEQSIFRNSNRKICELMRHSILYNKETKNLSLCPIDGSKLITRKLDKSEIIKKRYKVYRQETLPLVVFLIKQDFILHKINANQSVASIFSDIIKKLKL